MRRVDHAKDQSSAKGAPLRRPGGAGMLSTERDRAQASPSMQAILRLPRVLAETGYSRSTLYLRMAQGLWPKSVRLGPRAVGWPAREVNAINAARIAGKSDDEIRALVTALENGGRQNTTGSR
jgi:prophage regulatory protein